MICILKSSCSLKSRIHTHTHTRTHIYMQSSVCTTEFSYQLIGLYDWVWHRIRAITHWVPWAPTCLLVVCPKLSLLIIQVIYISTVYCQSRLDAWLILFTPTSLAKVPSASSHFWLLFWQITETQLHIYTIMANSMAHSTTTNLSVTKI